MKKIAILWFVVFTAAAISIADTHQLLISPIWIVNALAGFYLIRIRKQLSHPLWLFLFSFSTVFLASFIFDLTKSLEMKALLSVIGAIQIQSFISCYYYIAQRIGDFKYKYTALLSLPTVFSSLVGSSIFMLMLDVGENYYEFIDYFLEQFATGLGVICLLTGIQQWRHTSWKDYFYLSSFSLIQYLISMDRIFYACLVLPLLMCYYALRHHLKQFCLLIGLLVLMCSMYVSLPLAGEYWSESEVNLLSRISAYRLSLGIYLIIFLFICEMYIVNRRLYQSLQRMTFSDELTGLKTRRFVKDMLDQASLNHGSGILLDIDNFKKVNDVYGHAVGDAVLQHMSKLLKEISPQSAMVARWGGEEFLILLPNHTREACQQLCQLILDECQRRPFEHEALSLHMSFSMGAMTFDAFSLSNYAQILQQMDESLYLAKDRGKNQFVYT